MCLSYFRCRTLCFPLLNVTRLPLAHLLSLSRSFLMALLCIGYNTLILSVKADEDAFHSITQTLMKTLNGSDPGIEPWRMAVITTPQLNFKLLTTALCAWRSPCPIVQLSHPYLSNLATQMLWETMLKASVQSRRKISSTLLSFSKPVISLQKAILLVGHDLLLENHPGSSQTPLVLHGAGIGIQEDTAHNLPRDWDWADKTLLALLKGGQEVAFFQLLGNSHNSMTFQRW